MKLSKTSTMLQVALKTVYARKRYAVFTICLLLVISIGTLLWPNGAFLQTVWQSDVTGLGFKFNLTWSLLSGTPESIGWLAVGLVFVTAFLLGVVSAMIVYVFNHKRTALAGSSIFATTGSGAVAALFGIGCAACGPLLLGGLFAALGAGGLLIVLPLHGAELGIVAVLLLGYAVYSLARVITAPAVCAIE